MRCYQIVKKVRPIIGIVFLYPFDSYVSGLNYPMIHKNVVIAMPDNLLKKARMMQNPVLTVSRDFVFPFSLSRSTAGPGAGSRSVVVEFGDQRIKMRVVREDNGKGKREKDRGKGGKEDINDGEKGPGGDYALRCAGAGVRGGSVGGKEKCDRYSIYLDGKLFLDDVRLIPTIMHAPGQAFINIDARCFYDCAFCTSPDIRAFRRIPNRKWVGLIVNEAKRSPGLEAVAITSGLHGTVDDHIDDFCDIVAGVRENLPHIPIGVEPYVETREQIRRLKDAGADEIKINIQSFDRGIFSKICPRMDWERNLHMLTEAVEIFGRNRVVSNLIVGLGESPENIVEGIEKLASMGVVVSVRLLRINELNRPKLENALGVSLTGCMEQSGRGEKTAALRHRPETLIEIAEKQREINRRHGLFPERIRTMCHRCGCCDLNLY